MRKPVYAIYQQQRRSLISTVVVCCLDSIIPLVSISEIASLYLDSTAEQAGLSLAWLQTLKTCSRNEAQIFRETGLGKQCGPRSDCWSSSLIRLLLLWSHVMRKETLKILWPLQPSSGARPTVLCVQPLLVCFIVCKNKEGSGETAQMRRLTWAGSLYKFLDHSINWAAAWQNQQNRVCAQRRFRSAWASFQTDQSLHCAFYR